MSKFRKLFEPIKLGSLQLHNRITMPAITTNYDLGDENRLLEFYAERARGGVSLIIIGALQTIYPGGRSHIGTLNLYDDGDIPVLRALTKTIHENGSKAGAQLATYGYWAKSGMDSTPEDIGPSEVLIPTIDLHPRFSHFKYLPKVRALHEEEIVTIVEAIGDAAVRAKEADFDAIELQVVGGNLFCRFVNPFTNRRSDGYGGTLENRTRMLVEAISNIRHKLGKDFPLICRIPGLDMVPWGLGLDSWKEVARIIESAGADALSIYPGWHESREPRTQMCVPRGAFVYLAEAIKKIVTIPVAANIRINDPLLAEQILAEGRADVIAMGTPLIADADFPNKARKNGLEDIRMCTACCNCWSDILKGEPLSCSVNARAGKESEYRILPTREVREVTVIGGGPAGMEAARVAALRGHRVTLFEKRAALGGQLLYGIIPPYKEEWRTFIGYLSTQIRKLGVEVKLNEEFTIETAKEYKADVVIVATGATPIIPAVPGVNGNNVCTAIEILEGTKKIGNGISRIIVLGGGSIGCEVAEFLYQEGKGITILEMLDHIGENIDEYNRWIVLDRINNTDIRIETNIEAQEITERGVKIVRSGKYQEFFEADLIVIAVGMRSVDKIVKELEGRVPILHKIGDCAKPGKVKNAIEAGFQISMKI